MTLGSVTSTASLDSTTTGRLRLLPEDDDDDDDDCDDGCCCSGRDGCLVLRVGEGYSSGDEDEGVTRDLRRSPTDALMPG